MVFFFILLWLGCLIGFSQSPFQMLMGIIMLSLSIGSILLAFGKFLLFFIWGLVYVGGMMIIFTYVVFSSDYQSKIGWLLLGMVIVGGGLWAKKAGMTTTWMVEHLHSCNLSSFTAEEGMVEFSLMGEFGFPTLVVVFLVVGIVLNLLLIMLKVTTHQHLQSLQ